MADRFLIAPLQKGQQNNLTPWLIPDDAFEQLRNAYVFRGRIKKRFGSLLLGGSQLTSRLRINLGNTTATPTTINLPTVLNATLSNIGFAAGMMFSIGSDVFIVPGTGASVTLTTNSAITGDLDTTTGIVTFTGTTAGTSVYFYPAKPVMGLKTREVSTINGEDTIAFDTRFSYRYSSGWERLNTETASGDAVWTGSDSQFFWTTNWRGTLNDDYIFFATNYNSADGLRYLSSNTWSSFYPIINNTTSIRTARIILPFKDRLIFLNTIENDNETSSVGTTAATTGNFSAAVAIPAGGFVVGQQFIIGDTVFTISSVAAGAQPLTVAGFPGRTSNATGTLNAATGALVITGNNTNPSTDIYFFNNDNSTGTNYTYVNRCRFSVNGNPISGNAYVDTYVGLGGYVDAPTKEAIISAEFLKDRLIVYFERSTWELVYTGNQVLPFIWQKINTELGAESTFSIVPFDKVVLGVGNVGIHACSGANVERIDELIPDEVFDVSNSNEGVNRVYGIRDYFTELVYWAFPSADNSSITYPNRVLVYNYATQSWAFFDDSITCFGYYQNQTFLTWADITWTWAEWDTPWGSPTAQEKFRKILAGNQQGWTFTCESGDTTGMGIARNAPSLQISVVSASSGVVTLTVTNHNLLQDDYIYIENCSGSTELNDTVFQVQSVVDANNITISFTSTVSMYTGGGTIARVSQIDILTKQYNFYVQDGRNSCINKIDWLVDRTSNGAITIDYYASSANLSLNEQGSLTGSLMDSGVLETSPYTTYNPLEAQQTRLWHTTYPIANGECIQMRIYLSDSQMKNTDVSFSDFTLHSFLITSNPTGARLE